MAYKNKGFVISPSQLTSDQDDWNPTGFSSAGLIRVSSDSSMRAITSMVAQSTGNKKIIENIGSYPLYFPSQHPDGTSTNRFDLYRDFILFPSSVCTCIYNGTRWIIIDTSNSFENTHTFRALTAKWSPGSVTTGDHPEWSYTVNSATFSSTAPNSTNPCRNTIGTSTSTSASGQIYLNQVGSPYSYGGAMLGYEACVQIPTLSDGSNTFMVFIGFSASNSSTNNNIVQNNSAAIKYTDGINSGKWHGATVNNSGTESTVDLGITVAANTWYQLGVYINKSADEVRFYIDGVYCGRLTANLPATNSTCVPKTAIKKQAGSTARTIEICSMYAYGIY